MKKLILLLTLLPILSYGQTTTPYVEVNAGISTGIVPFFPGASVLYGATTEYNSGIILDYEAGIAFPSLITFKGGVGYNFNGTQVSVGIRPWPTTTYGQVEISRPKKLSDIVITVESMLWSENFFVQRGLITIGWRFKNMKYRDIRKINKK